MHHPVVNKRGDTIVSAVTNLDLHDIARVARTYGVRRFYVVTPLHDQQAVVKKIVSHWLEGPGGGYNPARRQALSLIRLQESLEAVLGDIASREGRRPETVATDARPYPESIGYAACREMLLEGKPCVLLLGTAWGLTRDLVESADHILEPVWGRTAYNHLSVRCAAAVILDRLVGKQ